MDLSLYKDVTWNGSSFWHGTSTFFLDSIRQTGLGAIHPGTDLKLLDVLRFLYDEIQRLNISHPVLEINRHSIEATIAQRDLDYNGLLLNYRHKGVYVSASPLRAANYACMNKAGSEILEKCLILLSVLINEDADPQIPPELDLFGVRQCLNIFGKPIMIEIVGLADNDILLENGSDATQLIREMRELFPHLTIAEQFKKLQFCNFLLLQPVPINALRFYEVDFEGTLKNKDFQYYLTRI